MTSVDEVLARLGDLEEAVGSLSETERLSGALKTEILVVLKRINGRVPEAA